ncbi:MAG: hypothetical protein FWB86_10200 [Treponema sp.]|nr:hypothetical protein [Treponema sp.]
MEREKTIDEFDMELISEYFSKLNRVHGIVGSIDKLTFEEDDPLRGIKAAPYS